MNTQPVNFPVALANDNYDVRGQAGTFSAATEDAVDAAHKASAAAHKAGTKDGHERAARMHRLAAKRHTNAGDTENAGMHEGIASGHDSMAETCHAPALANELFVTRRDGENFRLALDNETEIDADGWALIAPFGEHPKTRLYREGGQVKEQKYIQVLDAAAAEAMVVKENSLFGRLKRAFIGVPVFKGHGDLNEVDPAALSNDKQKIKLGVVDQIRQGGRGLEAHFALDHDGAEAVRAGWKYPSGFWYVRPEGTRGDAILARPFKLISVALTPHPNISGVESLANEAAPTGRRLDRLVQERTPARAPQNHATFPNPSGVETLAKAGARPSEEQPNTEPTMKLIAGWLIGQGCALADTDNPTESMVLEAIQRLHTSKNADVTALGNEKQTLSGTITTLTNERNTCQRKADEVGTALAKEQAAWGAERKGRAELAVDLAIQRGKVTVAQRDPQITALVNSADFDAAAKSLLEGATLMKLVGQNTESGKQGAALSNDTMALQNEYNMALQTELIASGQDPIKAHQNIMRLPKYAALAEKLMPKKY